MQNHLLSFSFSLLSLRGPRARTLSMPWSLFAFGIRYCSEIATCDTQNKTKQKKAAVTTSVEQRGSWEGVPLKEVFGGDDQYRWSREGVGKGVPPRRRLLIFFFFVSQGGFSHHLFGRHDTPNTATWATTKHWRSFSPAVCGLHHRLAAMLHLQRRGLTQDTKRRGTQANYIFFGQPQYVSFRRKAMTKKRRWGTTLAARNTHLQQSTTPGDQQLSPVEEETEPTLAALGPYNRTCNQPRLVERRGEEREGLPAHRSPPQGAPLSALPLSLPISLPLTASLSLPSPTLFTSPPCCPPNRPACVLHSFDPFPLTFSGRS